MKKYLILFILLFASACTFQVNVLEPQTPTSPPASTPVSLATPTTLVLTPTLTVTPSPVPTDTSTPLPPPTIVKSPDSSSIVPIVFPPNGTSQTIAGNLAANSSQLYSLNAFQGQVMSVSILPEKPELQNTYQLQITGRNGAVLCPLKENPCPFWRGTLPSTQEYLIKVKAQDSGHFKMLVAINPPGTVNQTFNYVDPQGRFSLTYPDDFAPAYYNAAQVTKIPPAFSLQYIDTQQLSTTNLNEVYYLLGINNDPQQVTTCTGPLNFEQPETELGETTINGVNFTKSQGGGVAAGNIYEQVYYRGVHNGSCVEITYFVHYGNIGNYPPGAVKEFDRTALYQELDEITASLILK